MAKQDQQPDPGYFYAKLKDINELYVEAKEVIILAENFDQTHEVYLSPLNELRNALDHLMRCIVYPDKIENEFDEAKEHLYRAGYDAYEVLSINVSDRIIKIVEQYNSGIISTIFPTYYEEIKPRLIELRVQLAEERAHKKLNPETGTKSFTPYKEKVSALIRFLKICEQNIPALQGEKKRKRVKSFYNTAIGIVIGIVVTIAGTFLYENYFKTEKAIASPKQNKNINLPVNKASN